MEKSVTRRRITYKRKSLRRQKAISAGWLGRPITKKVEFTLNVYAVQNSVGTQYYSFGTTGSNPQHYYDFFSDLVSQNEFKQLANQYGVFKMTGASLRFARQLNAAQAQVYYLPDVAFYLGPQEDTTYFDKNMAYACDTAMRVQPLNSDGMMTTKYYRYPANTIISSGYLMPLGHKGAWCATNAIYQGGQAFKWYVYMGHNKDPSISTQGNVAVGTLTITTYFKFALARQRLNL